MNSKPHNLLFAFSPWAFVFIFLVHGAIISSNPLQVTEQLCDKDLFGTPNVDDCYHAMFWIPYMNSPAKQSPAATANRLFAEPQHLDPPFSAVKNKWAPNAIVQLPRIWKFGSCQIALVLQPYDKSYHQLPQVKPEFRETWSDVVKQVLRLRPCLQPETRPYTGPQGGYVPLIITASRPAGLYMYTTDSRFNIETMTPYMTEGKIFTPPDSVFLGDSSNTNSTSGLSLGLMDVSGGDSSSPTSEPLSDT